MNWPVLQFENYDCAYLYICAWPYLCGRVAYDFVLERDVCENPFKGLN